MSTTNSGKYTSRSINTPEGYKREPSGRGTIYNQTYIGFVRKNEDDIQMGRLKVWIPDLSGDSDIEETWYTINYCSPFAGATPIKKFENNQQNDWYNGNIKNGTKYTQTQNSYGFWAVPPDIDNEVIVLFVNGDPNQGYWIGCIYKQYMNHMVPGIPTSKSFEEGSCGVEEPPTAEYNKYSEIGNNLDPSRPRYEPLHIGLTNQGLYTDTQRGPATAGARRESPSHVYGMLTPDGSQMYADDNPENQFIRFRTKTGVQVLIHETCGYVYMNSKKGNSWIQISDDAIDFYTTKSFNVHAVEDINFHTDKNFNLQVAGNFNVCVEGNVKWETKGNWDQITTQDHKQDVGGSSYSTITKDRSILVKGSDSLDVNGSLIQHADVTFTMTSDGLMLTKGAPLKQNCSDVPNDPTVPVEAQIKEQCTLPDRLLTECYPETSVLSVVSRLTTHEPFKGHEYVCGDEEYEAAECPEEDSPDEAEETSSEDTQTDDDPDSQDQSDDDSNDDPDNDSSDDSDDSDDDSSDDNSDDSSDDSSSSSSDDSDSSDDSSSSDDSDPDSQDQSDDDSNDDPDSDSSSSSSGSSGSSSSSSDSSGSTSSGDSTSSSDSSNSSSNSTVNKPLLTAISNAGNPDPSNSYNAAQGGGSGTPAKLTNKTLAQIDDIQDDMKSDSTATGTGIGKYNIPQSALREAKEELGLSDSTKFTPSIQDKLAEQLLKDAGIEKWKNGKKTTDDFIDDLASIWPSLPTSDGKTTAGSTPAISLTKLKTILSSMRVKKQTTTDTTNYTVVIGTQGPKCIVKVIAGDTIGSGTVINWSGSILTSAQVIGKENWVLGARITIESAGKQYPTKVVSFNQSKDIAYLQLIYNQHLVNFIPINLASFDEKNGKHHCYGYANGETLTRSAATNSGETNQTVKFTNTEYNDLRKSTLYGLTKFDLIDTKSLKPGMAGGPILNGDGILVGVNSAASAASGFTYGAII
jgi:muramidase (phage lysozyme)